MQLYGGSVTSSVRNQLSQLDVRTVARSLSVFDCEVALPNQAVEDSLCAVLDNILSRGTPTLCSPYIERVLAKRLQLTRERRSSGSFKFDFSEAPNGEMNDLLRRALVIIDPRLGPAEISAKGCDSEKEREFLQSILPNVVGSYASQLLELQRPIDSIVKGNHFQKRRVDFACEFPGKTGKTRGLVVEIDGAQHHYESQANSDQRRDKAVQEAGWESLRIRTSEFSSIPSEKMYQLKAFFQKEHAQLAADNYEKPFWQDEQTRRVFQLVLVPLAIARIQKTFVQLIRSGVLSLDAARWRIAVHERDVPCAWLAIEDSVQLLSNMLNLQGRAFCPTVEMRVYCSKEFAKGELSEPGPNLGCDYRREVAGFRGELSDGIEPFDADVFLDIAMLQPVGLTVVEPFLRARVCPNGTTAVIRSARHIDTLRRVNTDDPIAYNLDSKEKGGSLNYFLRYLFRKEEFREGQLDILERTLARKNTIGLLPTGAGKSLCYQLSALLQPGITLVVDPLKSLMHDQDDHLKEAGIDTTTFIDSSLDRTEKTARIKRFQNGEFQFTFVSPERLMIQEFRNALTKMGTGASPKWFAYCVIDEAHCVSEWGHDFRTAYLRLGDNARKFCRPASGDLPFIALTGTASFDVLNDVQRELQLEDDQAIVKLDSYEREELHFEVIRVKKPQDQPVRKRKDWKLVAEQKDRYLVNWLRKLPYEFGYQSGENSGFYERNGERTNSGLIFCPHVRGDFGIHEVSTYLKENLPHIAARTGEYGGTKRKGESDSAHQNRLEKTQRAFRNNDLALLVATKAFGMGIDKPNIRYTVHFNMPQSLEAFYQEAGRAGRDRQKAVCALLFSEEFSDKGLMQTLIRNAFRGEDKEKKILNELLSEIEWPDTEKPDSPGIEKILDTMTVGQTQQILIPFENGRIKTMATYTHKDEKKLDYAYEWSDTIEEFADKKLRVPVTEKEKLKKDFERIRTESETFKAVYRLSVVGVIKDYTISYNPDRIIEAIVRKHSEDDYIKTLTAYVSRYMSNEEAKRVPDEIRQRKGETVLQKCLGYLIWFVYNRIAKRREEALDVMAQAAKVGSYPNENHEKDRDECRRDFSDFVYNYFDSRYTPELRKKLYDYDLDLVWQYIDKVGGEPSPIKHLRGSCDRLLVENPDNAALLLLRAYARIFLGYGEEDVLGDLKRGFESFEKQVGHFAVVSAASRFYREVERQGNLGLPVIASTMSKLHLSWLKELNQRLEGGE